MAQIYNIRSGDTLSKVAKHFGITVDDIMLANPQIENRNKIFIGQNIALPKPGPSNGSIHLALSNGEGPTWYQIAQRELNTGVQELPGPQHNPRILEYHASTTLGQADARQDETPWCSSFVNWCISQSNHKGTNSAWARSWLNFGVETDEPRLGCIVVLKRGSSPTKGHVGFYKQSSSGLISLLGGNQGNRVKVSRFEKNRLLSYRWPKNTSEG